MKTKIRPFIYTLLLVLLPTLFFACSSPFSPMEEESASIRLVIEKTRAPNTDINSNHNLVYEVILKSSKTEKKETIKEGSPLLIKGLPTGDYTVYVKAEDDDFLYQGKKDVKVEPNKTTDVLIEIETIQKGGQICLNFKDIRLDSTTSFNVELLYQGQLLKAHNDIKATDIIGYKYTIPSYLPDGNYEVKLTGGNINEEQYVVHNKEEITVKQGKVSEVNVKAVPYKTIYLDGDEKLGTGGDGTKGNPIHNIYGAMNLIKDVTDPVRIIVTNSVRISNEPVILSQGQNITFIGEDAIKEGTGGRETVKASFTNSMAKELFRLEGADVSFVNIDVEVPNDNSYPSITFNSGSLSLYDNVYIKEIKLNNNNVIKIRAPLMKDKEYWIRMDNFTEDTKILDLSLSSSFDPTNITLLNPSKHTSTLPEYQYDFYVDNRGILKRLTYNQGVNITGLKDDWGKYTSYLYQVKLGQEIIVPLSEYPMDIDPLGENSFILTNLKKGLNYTLEIYSRYERDGQTTKPNGVTFTYENYDCYINESIFLSGSSMESPSKEILLTSGKRCTGSIKILNKDNNEAAPYPLHVTLTSSSGEEQKVTLEGFGYYINYLTPDTYTVTIESENPAVRYTAEVPNVTVNEKEGVNLYFLEKKLPVYYVKQGETVNSTMDGSKVNPFTSLRDAITTVSSVKEPITLIIQSNISEDSGKIDISLPLDITILGESLKENDPTSGQLNDVPPCIRANNGLFTISNDKASVSLKNVELSYQKEKALETENLIDVVNGELNILQNVIISATVIDRTTEPICAINVNETGKLNIFSFASTHSGSYILLKGNSKISLLAPLEDLASNSTIRIKLEAPTIGKAVLNDNGQDILIKKSYKTFQYVNNEYAIDNMGRLISYDYLKVSDLDDIRDGGISGDRSIPIKVIVTNQNELNTLGRKIRGFPKGGVDLTIRLDDSITTIGKEAFNYDLQGSQAIKTLYIESTALKSIGDNAFSYSEYLTSVTLPEGVTEIGKSAFDYTVNLRSLDIPSTLQVINDYAFRTLNSDYVSTLTINTTEATKLSYFGLNSFSYRTIESTNLGANASWYKKENSVRRNSEYEEEDTIINELNSSYSNTPRNEEILLSKIVTMNDAITNLNNFVGGDLKLSVNLSTNDDITLLKEAIKNFKGNALELYIPSKTSDITSLPTSAFEGCSKLKSITLPNSVKTIGANAFSGCTMLSEVNVRKLVEYGGLEVDNSPWKGTNASNEIVLDSSTTPSDFAYKLTGEYSSYTWSKALTAKEVDTLLQDPTTIGAVNIFASELPSSNISSYSGTIALDLSGSAIDEIPSRKFSSCTNLHSVKLPNKLKVIDSRAFDGCTKLTSIIIPDTVYKIGDSAFANTGLKEAEFIDTTSMWELSLTTSLTEYIPFTVKATKEENATELKKQNYAWNKYVTNSDVRNMIKANSAEYTPIELLEIYVTLKSKAELVELANIIKNEIPIRQDSPEFNVALTMMMSGEGNDVIGSEFNNIGLDNPTLVPKGCAALGKISIRSPNITIKSGAFMNCKNLTIVNFDDTTTVEGGAFTGCRTLDRVSNLTVSIEPGLVLNGKEINSFLGVEGEGNITIPSDNTIESIADYAFYGSNIEVLDLGSSIKQIGVYAFANSQFLSDVKLGTNQAFDTLNTGLFYNTNLGVEDPTSGAIKSLLIPENVTTIMPGAIYTENYKKMSADINPNISFRSQNQWHNEGNSKTFDPSKAADVLQCLVKDTVIGTDGIPTNEIYTNISNDSDPVPSPSPNPGP